MISIRNGNAADTMWTVYGNFGMAQAPIKILGNTYTAEAEKYKIESTRQEYDNGVIVQTGKFTNTSDSDITVTYLASKYVYDGGEYEVYTQASTWENESVSSWQRLNSTIGGEVYGIRDAYGAEPFVGLYSLQSGRGEAFHILADCAWKYTVTRVHLAGKASQIELELGINNRNLNYILKSGESLDFPTIIYYGFKNKLDLDCWKLHDYANKNYPKRRMPIMFNTWMYKFEYIDFENVASQIDRAAELGIEYFVIDAGWFGQGDFWKCRGDWYENTEAAFMGRMKELSDKVRAAGMKFGFWLEIESVGVDSNIIKQHPEYFFNYKNMYLLDFRRKDACDWIIQTVCGLLEKYNAEFIKFDFNQDSRYDMDSAAFVKYYKGFRRVISEIKNRHPELYAQNCASGGLRETFSNSLHYDGMWLSDNHSLYEGMRIFKDTIRRLPPQAMEKWASVTSVKDFSHSGNGVASDKIVASNDALWVDIRGVDMSWLRGFLTGGAIGISCSLTEMSDELFKGLREHIAAFKRDRDFWRSTVCHILCDTETMLALQYRCMETGKSVIACYSSVALQNNIRVYPILCENEKYIINGSVERSGRDISENGIDVPVRGSYKAELVSLDRA